MPGRIKYYLLHILSQFREYKIRKYAINNLQHSNRSGHIVIAGMYRGGTTWLAEVLQNFTGYPIIWEPLNRNICRERDALNLGWKFCLPPGKEDNEIKDYLDGVLSGKILSRGLLQATNLEELKKHDQLIVKFCRLNMSLPWFLDNFPEVKVVYLIRNPYATVASQLRHPAWEQVFNDSFLMPEGKYIEAIDIHKDYLRSLGSKAERLAADWCLDNYMMLNQHKEYLLRSNLISVFYENLLLNPIQELERILRFYHLEITAINEHDLRKKSSSSLTTDGAVEVNSQLGKSRGYFTDTDIDKIYDVTEHFGLHHIYGKSDLPQVVLPNPY